VGFFTISLLMAGWVSTFNCFFLLQIVQGFIHISLQQRAKGARTSDFLTAAAAAVTIMIRGKGDADLIR
jgi:Mn2+/Fe2+ NRAMP family transporter